MITNMLLSNKDMKSFIISILLVLYAGTIVAQDELKVKSFGNYVQFDLKG